MSCSYKGIAMALHDSETLSYYLSSIMWQKFCNDIFVV